jgi:hypothetical protein
MFVVPDLPVFRSNSMRFTAVLAALTLAACASAGKSSADAMPSATSAEEYRTYLMTGTGIIEGRALTERSGATVTLEGPGHVMRESDDVIVAAKQTVTLDPATPYALEWYRRYGNTPARFDEVPSDSLFRRARRVTRTDDKGQFRFEGVPPGQYILRTRISWTQARDQFRSERRGGVAGAVIPLGDGEHKNVTLNGLVTPPMAF